MIRRAKPDELYVYIVGQRLTMYMHATYYVYRFSSTTQQLV